jgi:hypothetical protein
MPKNDPFHDTKDAVFQALEVALDAQLRAVRRLRLDQEQGESASRQSAARSKKSMSQVDMTEDILQKAGQALHISDIIEQIKKIHGLEVDRESLVSALSKRVQRGDRFVRSGPNQFALSSARRAS